MQNKFKHSLLIAACAIGLYHSTYVTAFAAENPTAITTNTFSCEKSDSGKCYFVLYSYSCNEASAINGKASLVCTYGFLQEFTLQAGERKTLTNLPKGFRQCPSASNVKPEFPSCAK